MRHNLWQIGLLALLILALASPIALAQGTSGDRLVVGRPFVLPAGEELPGNLAVLGGSVTLELNSVVQGDVAVLGGNLTIAGTVQGDVAVFGGSVTLQESAVIEGNLAALGGSIARDPSAVVAGDVFGGGPLPFPAPLPDGGNPIFPAPSRPLPPSTPETTRGGFLGFLNAFVVWQLVTIGWVLGLALLGVLAVALAPKAMGRIASQAAGDTFVSFGMGLLTLVVGFLLGLLLLIACCIGLLGWLALGVAWLIGWLAVGLWLGQRLLQALHVRDTSSLGEAALGVTIITILARLPWCIGFLCGLVLGCIGLGAVVLTRFGTQPPSGKTTDSRRGTEDSAMLPPVIPPPVEPEAAFSSAEVPGPSAAEITVPSPDESRPEPEVILSNDDLPEPSAGETSAAAPTPGTEDNPPAA